MRAAVIIRVLGCHGSELTIVDGQGGTYECRTCGFLVNETCMVDAGSISAGLQEAEEGKIRHVLLSHAHFDHIKGLPLLADNLAGRVQTGRLQTGPVKIRALSEVLDGLRRHIFNDVVFPDFTRVPTKDSAPLAYHALDEAPTFSCDNCDVTAVLVNSIVPTPVLVI